MTKNKKILDAAYESKKAISEADGFHGSDNTFPWWNQMSMREAFVAGAKWQHEQDINALKKFFD